MRSSLIKFRHKNHLPTPLSRAIVPPQLTEALPPPDDVKHDDGRIVYCLAEHPISGQSRLAYNQ